MVKLINILIVISTCSFLYYITANATDRNVKYEFINLDTNEIFKTYQGLCNLNEDQYFYEVSCKIDGVWTYENIRRNENISYRSQRLNK